MGGIIYRHKFVFIKSINPAAEHAILFAHGGIRRSQKAYATPVIVPKGRKLVYYAYHSEDTNTDVGWRLLLNNSTYNPAREPKNINPKEFIHADNTTFNYTLSNAFESELALPTAHHDVIGVITRTYMQEVFEAISIYRPAIKYIHCIHAGPFTGTVAVSNCISNNLRFMTRWFEVLKRKKGITTEPGSTCSVNKNRSKVLLP